ncbi:GNAT family N-acetyltransferase [Kribbella jiaozuonensis]|uniref:GNAT family N-acetyltransferase n=1 Tax=Kribbella jiaozuonensis TaxID=2575441 RepID=A0A4U3M5V7_9ACTN|nr:GNAT family N-acetyltransferase [Kribbella jiaozuonensis]TKK79234.1 GNAT family N-acetyltransferase [Kribbella jiaozuonensis]TKK83304.1 GNAT family N-acetyltransferase [Kribbella jiaozuonensis]
MLTIRSEVPPSRIPELTDLMCTAWWMSDRTPDEVARLVEHSDVIVALIHGPTDRLVGFARVITDYTHVALVLDVIVDESRRGSGLGAALLDAVINHSELAGVRSLELVCQPELVPFYRRWGFTDQVGASTLMRRTTDTRLISC